MEASHAKSALLFTAVARLSRHPGKPGLHGTFPGGPAMAGMPGKWLPSVQRMGGSDIAPRLRVLLQVFLRVFLAPAAC
jgi:hypothetical protein